MNFIEAMNAVVNDGKAVCRQEWRSPSGVVNHTENWYVELKDNVPMMLTTDSNWSLPLPITSANLASDDWEFTEAHKHFSIADLRTWVNTSFDDFSAVNDPAEEPEVTGEEWKTRFVDWLIVN